MSDNLSDRWARAERRAFWSEPLAERTDVSLDDWSRNSAIGCALAFSSGRLVGGRPRSGKETGFAQVLRFGS